jgi:DNA-binding beta-propeller fold protein YncE
MSLGRPKSIMVLAVRMALSVSGWAAIILGQSLETRADTFFVSNWSSDSIVRFTADGVGAIFYTGESEHARARGLTFDHQGNLYAATWHSGILKFAPDGSISLFPGFLALNDPRGIAFDSASNLFVANTYSDQILRYAPDGSLFIFAFRDGISFPTDLVFDRAGNLYVANPGSNTVTKITPQGPRAVFASGLASPVGLAVDAAGNLYVANQGNNTVLRFTPDGASSLFASAGLNAPSGMAFDSRSNLYVVNTGNNTVQKFTPAGVGSVFASTGLNAPAYIAIQPDPDSDGDGVPDAADQCPGSAPGAAVDAQGCSIEQLVPCSGPRPGLPWRNHGQYVSAITKIAHAFAAAGFITRQEEKAVIRRAARSHCAK